MKEFEKEELERLNREKTLAKEEGRSTAHIDNRLQEILKKPRKINKKPLIRIA